MAGTVGQPVFIFLPVTESEPNTEGLMVDPVCGRALAEGMSAGRLLHRGRQHYFCSLRCAERFASEPLDFDSR